VVNLVQSVTMVPDAGDGIAPTHKSSGREQATINLC
jgi:hypothetical protein